MPLFAQCDTKAYHDVDRHYWLRWTTDCVILSQVAQLVSWLLLEKMRYLSIATSKLADINSIQKPGLYLWHYHMFYVAIAFIYTNEGTFSLHNFFSDSLSRCKPLRKGDVIVWWFIAWLLVILVVCSVRFNNEIKLFPVFPWLPNFDLCGYQKWIYSHGDHTSRTLFFLYILL